jgi:hypothetical protein
MYYEKGTMYKGDKLLMSYAYYTSMRVENAHVKGKANGHTIGRRSGSSNAQILIESKTNFWVSSEVTFHLNCSINLRCKYVALFNKNKI